MATITERKGRFTAQVRLRGFRSMADTFDTREKAEEWAKATEEHIRTTGSLPLPTLPDIENSSLKMCGVYFLFKASECVYIGQSYDVSARIRDHRKKIDFDIFTWTPVHHEQLLLVEQMYIGVMRPKFNQRQVDDNGLVRHPARHEKRKDS